MNNFFKSLLETIIFRFFSFAYPISLKFLYKDEKYFNFYLTLIIIFFSIIYFFCYYLFRVNYRKENKSSCYPCIYYTKQFSYFLIGYLVQLNLAFLDTYEIKDGKFKIKNLTLFILKILMILETMKRIYYYAKGIKLFFSIESDREEMDRCYYVMSFEIVYAYFWYNVYSNFFGSGYELPKSYLIFGLIVAIIHGILAMGCYYLVVKICFGVLNLIYLSAQIYSIYWRKREHY